MCPSHPNSLHWHPGAGSNLQYTEPLLCHPPLLTTRTLWPLEHQGEGKGAQPWAPLVPKLCPAEGTGRAGDKKLPCSHLPRHTVPTCLGNRCHRVPSHLHWVRRPGTAIERPRNGAGGGWHRQWAVVSSPQNLLLGSSQQTWGL